MTATIEEPDARLDSRLRPTLVSTALAFTALALVVVGMPGPINRLEQTLIDPAVAWTMTRPTLATGLAWLGEGTGKFVSWTLCALLIAWLWVRHQRSQAVYTAAVMFTATAATTVVKELVDRDRPRTHVPAEELLTGSFPSGHLALAVALAGTVLVLVARTGDRAALRRTTRTLALVIALIGLDRIFQGRHFPTDVLGGLLLGTVAVLACLPVLKPLSRARWPCGSR